MSSARLFVGLVEVSATSEESKDIYIITIEKDGDEYVVSLGEEELYRGKDYNEAWKVAGKKVDELEEKYRGAITTYVSINPFISRNSLLRLR